MAGLAPWEAARQEAFEEAGVFGDISKAPIGTYNYLKDFGTKRESAECKVVVFPLRVTDQSKQWPERRQREKLWVDITEAQYLVAIEDLRKLLANVEGELTSSEA